MAAPPDGGQVGKGGAVQPGDEGRVWHVCAWDVWSADTKVAMRPFSWPRVACWSATVVMADCRAALAWASAAWAEDWADWSTDSCAARRVWAAPRASMALEMSPVATARYSVVAPTDSVPAENKLDRSLSVAPVM